MKTSNFLAEGGEMGALIAKFDWCDSPLGPIGSWPPSLRITLSTVLSSPLPMSLCWGRESICFYNDAFRRGFSTASIRPVIIGLPARQVWPEMWEIIGPKISDVLEKGEGIYNDDGLKHVYWMLSYSPVLIGDNAIGGVLIAGVEITPR